MTKKNKSGLNRKDRTTSFWIEHGDNLLDKMKNRRTIGKRILASLELLREAELSQNLTLTEQYLAELNKEKYSLKDDWKSWVNRSTQKKKDANREKLYIDKKSALLTSTMAQGKSESSFISHLITCLNALGISSVHDLYTIQECLKPFDDALNSITTESLQEEDITPDSSVVTIIKKMTDIMTSNKITSYKELLNLTTSSKQIKAKLNKVSLIEQKLINQANALNTNDEILKRDKEIADLNKEVVKLKRSLDSAKSKVTTPSQKQSIAFNPKRKRINK